jgi:hypothetical protein
MLFAISTANATFDPGSDRNRNFPAKAKERTISEWRWPLIGHQANNGMARFVEALPLPVMQVIWLLL